MGDLIKGDPLRGLFAWPRWLNEWEDSSSSQRGLKIRDTEKDIIAEAVVAGVGPEEVDVEIEDGILTIKAEKKEEVKEKGEYRASSYQYYYTAALSGGMWDKAKAEVKHGVVSITIPKAEAVRPKKIKVKSLDK